MAWSWKDAWQSLWNKEGLASSPFHKHLYQHHYKTQPTYSKGRTPRPKSVKTQSNCNKTREMWMGTKLPFLQKCKRGLGQRASETTSTVWCTAEVPTPNLRYKADPGPPMQQELLGTTKPALPNILQCAWPIQRTEMLVKRMGEENGTIKWQIQTWLLLWLGAWLRVRWGREILIQA